MYDLIFIFNETNNRLDKFSYLSSQAIKIKKE